MTILWFAVVPVLVVIEALLLLAVLRYRHRVGNPEPVEMEGATYDFKTGRTNGP